MPAPSPICTAICELDHPDIIKSPEWAKAVEAGRWSTALRPHTTNRRYGVFATRSVQKPE
jgi:tRNA (Thr-GGU) A37 N-methylase